MHKLQKIIFERLIRPLHHETKLYNMLVFEIPVLTNKINNFEHYTINIKDNNSIILSQTFFINSNKSKVVFLSSHEDPLISYNEFYLLTTQLDISNVNAPLSPNLSIEILTSTNTTIDTFYFENIKLPSSNEKYYSSIDNYIVRSHLDGLLTLHLGDENGNYNESTMTVHNNFSFDFYELLNNYSYIGLQFSYQNLFPEVEEKYIILGQKNIKQSQTIFDGQHHHYSIIDFSPIYLQTKDSEDFGWTKINSLHELEDFYNNNPIDSNYLFESDFNFLAPQYKRNNNIYAQTKILGPNVKSKTFHIDSPVCKQCPKNTKCLQIIPNGLSYSLYKKNLTLDENDAQTCSFYKAIPNE